MENLSIKNNNNIDKNQNRPDMNKANTEMTAAFKKEHIPNRNKHIQITLDLTKCYDRPRSNFVNTTSHDKMTLNKV